MVRGFSKEFRLLMFRAQVACLLFFFGIFSPQTLLSAPIFQEEAAIPAQKFAQNSASESSAKSGPNSFQAIPMMEGLAPLVDGKYGFERPSAFRGVPRSFVSLGSVESTYGIVVEKLHHRLSVFKLDQDGGYTLFKTYRAITGKDPEDKQSRGDFRTPEGIYFVTGRIRDEALPPKYGRGALVLDYPNIYDLRQRKTGHGIWIHGTDSPERLARPYDTEGCVVLSNEDFLEISKLIEPFEVPVVITKEMIQVEAESLVEPRLKATEMIQAWKDSWEGSRFQEYMSHYSENFKSLGRSKESWEKFKTGLSKSRQGDIRVEISDPVILSFEDQLLAVFLQRYESKEHSDYGRKFLYLKREGEGYKIIAEKWYKIQESSTVQNSVQNPTPSL
jgi:murein L,D-transpeptidase YafK